MERGPEFKSIAIAINEFLKQIITLATGSIVVLSSLMDKFATRAVYRLSLKLSLLMFALTIVIALVTWFLGGLVAAMGKARDSVENSFAVGVVITFLLFLCGIVSLTVFGWHNF